MSDPFELADDILNRLESIGARSESVPQGVMYVRYEQCELLILSLATRIEYLRTLIETGVFGDKHAAYTAESAQLSKMIDYVNASKPMRAGPAL